MDTFESRQRGDARGGAGADPVRRTRRARVSLSLSLYGRVPVSEWDDGFKWIVFYNPTRHWRESGRALDLHTQSLESQSTPALKISTDFRSTVQREDAREARATAGYPLFLGETSPLGLKVDFGTTMVFSRLSRVVLSASESPTRFQRERERCSLPVSRRTSRQTRTTLCRLENRHWRRRSRPDFRDARAFRDRRKTSAKRETTAGKKQRLAGAAAGAAHPRVGQRRVPRNLDSNVDESLLKPRVRPLSSAIRNSLDPSPNRPRVETTKRDLQRLFFSESECERKKNDP